MMFATHNVDNTKRESSGGESATKALIRLGLSIALEQGGLTKTDEDLGICTYTVLTTTVIAPYLQSACHDGTDDEPTSMSIPTLSLLQWHPHGLMQHTWQQHCQTTSLPQEGHHSNKHAASGNLQGQYATRDE